MTRPRALFLTPEEPKPGSGGGGLRSASLLAYLQSKYAVQTVTFTLQPHSKNSTARIWRNTIRLARGRPPLFDRYSGYEKQSGVGGISTKAAIGQQYLRGTQFTDTAGNVQFRTIFPSWYGGRTPHVHFKVFLGGNEVVASQIFFPDDISKEIFSSVEPYRQHASKRTTFNTNDPIKQGIYSDVTRQRGSYAAKAVLVVAQR